MKEVCLGGVIVGSGQPKICVSITGKDRDSVLKQAQLIGTSPADIVEWRLDFLEELDSETELITLAQAIRLQLQGKPLLVTFRTLLEGGEKDISQVNYQNVYRALIINQVVEAIDLELRGDSEIIQSLLSLAHHHQVVVIMSSHDFKKTPSKEAIISCLEEMEQQGADISKLAVMPNSVQDVLTVLEATNQLQLRPLGGPIVTMSMGTLGKISRLAGQLVGSAITFGALEEASAPGQIPVALLSDILAQLS